MAAAIKTTPSDGRGRPCKKRTSTPTPIVYGGHHRVSARPMPDTRPKPLDQHSGEAAAAASSASPLATALAG
ncbi:hypothetical protein amrb99_85900 [Actinomadura sp. RB99]|nr:hypothetical protein [Actinomadura sp. RB99]